MKLLPALLLAALLAAPPLFAQTEILAGYRQDFTTETDGTWPDGSKTGTWSVGFGSVFTPWVNFVKAKWDGLVYGDETRHFSSEGKFAILPGPNRSKYGAVIQWQAEKPGTVLITGKTGLVAKSSDAARFSIFHNEEKIYQSTAFGIPAQIHDLANPEPIKVKMGEGDRLFFVVDPAGEDNTGDDTIFVEDLRITGKVGE